MRDGHILYEITCNIEQKKIQTLWAEEGANLLDVFREQRIPMDAVCSGKGICGKCRVKVTKGHVPVTGQDQHFFNEQELRDGYRLACNVRVYENLSVEVCGGVSQIQTFFIEQ